MERSLEGFLKYLSIERNVSPHTLRSYKSDLRHFFSYLTEDQQIRDLHRIDPRGIRAYLSQVLRQGVRRSTLSRKMSTLRSFFSFLYREGHLPHNPTKTLASPKQERRLPTFLTPDEIMGMVVAPQGTGLLVQRDRAILETFYSAGIRVGELSALSLEDLDDSQGLLRVKGKGRKERLVPIGSYAIRAIAEYLVLRRHHSGPLSRGVPLFLNHRGGRLTTRGIYNTVRQHARAAVPEKQVSPHALRHTFATHLLDNGADLRSVQEMLGHASLSTTQKYTHLQVDRLMQIYDQAHPRSKKKDA